MNKIPTREEFADSIYRIANQVPGLTRVQRISAAVMLAQELGGDTLYELVNARFIDELKGDSKPVYSSTPEKCGFPHKVLVDWLKLDPYTLPPHIKSDGSCADGCCDNFICTECGYEFSIECPD